MHFSKTYTQLLLSLPQEFRENAIQYRQLKKIINQIVQELSSHGLDPSLLHQLLEQQGSQLSGSLTDDHSNIGNTAQSTVTEAVSSLTAHPGSFKVIYEFSEGPPKIEPRLRILLESPSETGNPSQKGKHKENIEAIGFDSDDSDSVATGDESVERSIPPGKSLLWVLQKSRSESHVSLHSRNNSPSASREIIIPLTSDSRFFELLYTTMESMLDHLQSIHNDFLEILTGLTNTIADSARPASSSRSAIGRGFHPHSPLIDDAGTVRVRNSNLSKSDLYSWRELFQLYIEAEIFESIHETDRGERSVEESERRLRLFAEQVTQRGLATKKKFKLKQSRDALEIFLRLNIFILDVKKFQVANAEATRKILKKHTKRTALPLLADTPSSDEVPSNAYPLDLLRKAQSLPLSHVLVQALGETLLPIIPHIDDYSCLICTSIAFKPIRLDCGHLFCVRCLVKMQKRGSEDCPVCRAPVVLSANRTNVDWALMNFMQDWFPRETREKLKSNEKEAAAEGLRELGLDPNARCIIM